MAAYFLLALDIEMKTEITCAEDVPVVGQMLYE